MVSVEDYEYYHVDEPEEFDPRPPKSGFPLEYFETKLHEKNHSRDWLEHHLARAIYVFHQRNFQDSIDL